MALYQHKIVQAYGARADEERATSPRVDQHVSSSEIVIDMIDTQSLLILHTDPLRDNVHLIDLDLSKDIGASRMCLAFPSWDVL